MNLNQWTRIDKLKTNFFEYLFPKFCVGCNTEGTWLCSECEENILPVVTQVCPDCGRISEYGEYCELCRYDITYKKVPGKKKPVKIVKRKPLQGIITAAYYVEGPTREIIHNFKYNSVLELKTVLGELMTEALKRNIKLKMPNDKRNPKPKCQMNKNLDIENSIKIKNCKIENYIITYTPLHYRRLAQRGYNQSELLAQELGEKTGLKVMRLLTKTKKTKRQVELTGKKRRENLKNSFKLAKSLRDMVVTKQSKTIKNKNILIVDDISTTGATLNECAAVLKANGAKKVWGLVVAKG